MRMPQYASLAIYAVLFLLFVWSTPRVPELFTEVVLVVAVFVLIGSIFWPRRDNGPSPKIGEPVLTDPLTFFLSVPLRAAKGVGVVVGIAASAFAFSAAAVLVIFALGGLLYLLYRILLAAFFGK